MTVFYCIVLYFIVLYCIVLYIRYTYCNSRLFTESNRALNRRWLPAINRRLLLPRLPSTLSQNDVNKYMCRIDYSTKKQEHSLIVPAFSCYSEVL